MDSPKKISELDKQINHCQRCPLYKTATHAVPGEGDLGTKIMFVGEAPGRVEDETGRPFVGRAGKLLEQLLKSIDLGREEVFITSVVKHRPPNNRQPKPAEIKACSVWLSHQLRIIQPKLIVTLGRFGMDYFLSKQKISQIHGTMVKSDKFNNFMVFPLYHPAAGLRSTRNKNKLFEDFKKLKLVINRLT